MKISGNGIEVSQQGSTSAETSPLNDPSRLPVSVIPSHYKLHFDFNVPQSFSYTGSLEISLEVSEAMMLCLNMRGIKALWKQARPSNPEKGIARLIFPNSLSGRGKLSMNFSGRIKRETSLNGIYENPYVNASGDVSSGICTLLRQQKLALPSPATFELSIRCPAHFQTVLSNMPEKDIKREGEFNTHVFDQTPRMSTYLLCMILGSYDVLSSTFGDTLISVYTPLKRSEQGKYPLKVALKCMEFFSTYFDVPYSLPNLDLIAVSRLSVGAMENWGLITYRESGLLVDESHTAPSHQQKIASLVSHEISHQWFGNLVTMSWWSDLWLNEGLATLFQYIGIQDLFSDYPSIPDQFVVNTSVPALRQDALESSHPIRVPIRESSEISSAFDRITYCKGAAVLCMLHNYLGKDTFREGIRVYVKKYSYGNAETEDLWACLSQAAQVDVESIMREWTLVKGYPLVRVSLLESNSIVLSQ
ncbi:Aminopeptidase, partial [Caligus rogercresseyi]